MRPNKTTLRHSLNLKLLLPLASACLLTIVVAYFGTIWLGSAQAVERLHQRATSIANTISYAAESMDSVASLQRLVSSLGAEHDLIEITAAGGEPQRILVSTYHGMVGEKTYRTLPVNQIASRVRAFEEGAESLWYDNNSNQVELVTRVNRPQGVSLLSSGWILVRVDARTVQAQVSNWAGMLAIAYTVLAFATFCYLAYALRKVVLIPVTRIIDAISMMETDEISVPVMTDDELGVLARVLDQQFRESREANYRLQEALREVNALRRALDEHSILSVSDRTGIITDVNTGFCNISGYSRQELLGKNHSSLRSGHHGKTFWRKVWKTIGTGKAWRGEICTQRKDGSLYWIDSTIVPYLGAEGTIEKFVSISFDITAQKQAKERLHAASETTKKLLAQAEAANLSKSAFLANMSHEIRTPMTAILGYAEMLVEDDKMASSPAERSEALATIRRNGDHLLSIINDILDLSKVEAGKLELETLPCSPHSIVAEVIALMRVRSNAKGIELHTVFENDLPHQVDTDPTRFRQALVNLVGNAIKFTEVGSVTVKVAYLEPTVGTPLLQCDVVDTGIGLSLAQREKIFQPFSQADVSATRKFGGTGLGLAISKRLASMLGGDIQLIESAEGAGSCFRLTIAAVPSVKSNQRPLPDTAISGHEPLELGKRPLAGLKIILAEDGLDNQRFISFIIKKEGADITVVDNGQKAYDAVIDASGRGNPYDVVLMDMQMPVLDGYQAASRLRDAGFQRPIIALTAHAMKGDREKCEDAGCSGYATKPIDRKALLSHILELHEASSGNYDATSGRR